MSAVAQSNDAECLAVHHSQISAINSFRSHYKQVEDSALVARRLPILNITQVRSTDPGMGRPDCPTVISTKMDHPTPIVSAVSRLRKEHKRGGRG